MVGPRMSNENVEDAQRDRGGGILFTLRDRGGGKGYICQFCKQKNKITSGEEQQQLILLLHFPYSFLVLIIIFTTTHFLGTALLASPSQLIM